MSVLNSTTLETTKEIEEIISDLFSGNINSEQQIQLDLWIQNNPDKKAWIDQILASRSVIKDLATIEDLKNPMYWEQMKAKTASSKRKLFIWKVSRIAAVFVFLLTVSFVIYYSFRPSLNKVNENMVALSKIKPGGNNAYLTLSDGSIITLNNVKNGTLAQQGYSTITKNSDQLVYNNLYPEEKSQIALTYNTLVTPQGGEYRITLPDGTKVWLNASSQLKYPVAFTENTREVWLEGEAYFEVAKNAEKPFLVKIKNKADIRVLGTHFNVMAYANEPEMQATLVEGSVQVLCNSKNIKAILTPGQQSILTNDKELKVIAVNTMAFTAWKDGLFLFNNEDMGSIMRKLSRWYNVKIIFETDEAKSIQFFGKVKRYENIDIVLNMITQTDKIDYLIKDNIIHIRKK